MTLRLCEKLYGRERSAVETRYPVQKNRDNEVIPRLFYIFFGDDVALPMAVRCGLKAVGLKDVANKHGEDGGYKSRYQTYDYGRDALFPAFDGRKVHRADVKSSFRRAEYDRRAPADVAVRAFARKYFAYYTDTAATRKRLDKYKFDKLFVDTENFKKVRR